MTEENKQPEKVEPQQTAAGCGILIFLVLMTFGACSMFSSQNGSQNTSSNTSTSIANTTASDRTPEQNLALIDGRTGQGAEQPYGALLDQVRPKCNESRERIADMTVVAVKLVKDNGRSTDNLDMLTGLRNATEEQSRQDCKEMYTLLVRTVIGGK